ncbi:hypothetical protein V5O48_015948, partial [Marasmius crinis-equi]
MDSEYSNDSDEYTETSTRKPRARRKSQNKRRKTDTESFVTTGDAPTISFEPLFETLQDMTESDDE